MPRVSSLLPVLSATGSEENDNPASAPLNRDKLSLYTAPEQNLAHFQHPEPGQIEETVATLRRSVEPYVAWCQGTYNRIKPPFQHGAQLGRDTYTYLKNPPEDFYTKAGVIGFTGILGLFLARGSRVKRLLYPAGLMVVSSSLYYPEQAASITKSTGDRVYSGAVQSYAAVEKIFKTQEQPKKDSETKP